MRGRKENNIIFGKNKCVRNRKCFACACMCMCVCVCVRVCGCGYMGEQACVWKGCLSLFRSYLFELPYLFDQMAGKVAASGRVLKTNLVRDDILKIMDGCWKMSFGSVARWHCCCCCCCWHKKPQTLFRENGKSALTRWSVKYLWLGQKNSVQIIFRTHSLLCLNNFDLIFIKVFWNSSWTWHENWLTNSNSFFNLT